MTNMKTPPSADAVSSRSRRSRPRKADTIGARALLAALAVSATLGGWAVIARDSQSIAPAAIEPLAGSTSPATPNADAVQLAPLPTVVAPPASLDEAASSQLAPLEAPLLRQAPLSPAGRSLLARPLARSRSSN